MTVAIGAVILVVAALAGVVLYMRRAASNGATLAQRETQLQEERERRLATEKVEREEREARNVEFNEKAGKTVTVDDAIDLLRAAVRKRPD